MTEFKHKDIRYARLVDRYSRHIKSPVLRLKFLNSVLAVDRGRSLTSRIPLVGTLNERALLVMELSKLLPPGQEAPFWFRVTAVLYRIRLAFYAVCVATVLGAGTGGVYLAARFAGSLSVPTEARDRSLPASSSGSGTSADAVSSISSTAGIPADRVWLAEQGDGFEFYSNGARVLTEFQTDGEPRGFYRFSLAALENNQVEASLESRPVGIVYHVSESDLLPFLDRYNSSLKSRSRALLEYAREKRLYNYVIDRFGRVYRIVPDEYSSNHAGNSVWGDPDHLYINLNPSFIGVCFEGRSDAGKQMGPDSINEAQVYAARVLTAVLRSKHGIRDENCVTHGLISVNPSNRLMGYHTDWVSGFPFEAMGLASKYDAEMLALSRLGFSYDSAYISAAGGKAWPGLERAESAHRERAVARGVPVEHLRTEQRKLYQRALEMQRSISRDKPEPVESPDARP